MSELRLAAMPPPDERRRLLCDALVPLVPGWRPLARDVLGDETRIDWVGTDAGGRCVIALIAEPGEDSRALTQALAQREWVTARLPDWVQLAPESGLRADLGVEVVLLAERFARATRTAARALGERGLRLARFRFVENGAGVSPLLEPLDSGGDEPPETHREATGFRSGLSAGDLDLTAEERAAFEGE